MIPRFLVELLDDRGAPVGEPAQYETKEEADAAVDFLLACETDEPKRVRVSELRIVAVEERA